MKIQTSATILGLTATAALLYAVRFSSHPVRWIIGLLIAVPIVAAVAAGLSEPPSR